MVRLTPESANRNLMVSSVFRLRDAKDQFEAGAILPDVPSRHPADGSETEPFLASPDTPDAALIEVFRPSARLVDAAVHHSQQPTDDARDRLAGLSREYGGEYLFMHKSPANMLTSTVYPGTTLYPGMHVDNRDNKPLASRIGSRRRMGLNIGPDHRWLLVCFPDILTIAQELNRDGACIPGNVELCEFVDSRLQDLTCLWIPVQHSEAYIAPTDLTGHDGSTLGALESSIYFFLGHWSRRTG